ncbi:MAG TPA: hypothetical protein VNR88_05915 [Hyphomicrobium sp.]|nr:hypothetical protein [Hyphomicrobium sp.]
MSNFERWSRWFACARELGPEKAKAAALMTWVAAHAAEDGTGIEFSEETWATLAEETGVTIEEARQALATLIAHGLITAVGQETPERLVARAVI